MTEQDLQINDNRRRRLRDICLEDFWTRMLKPEGCWLYDGAKDINGYGYVKNPLPEGPQFITAHRLAWILKYGPIPEGLVVMHKCDIRACCNPDHLRLGTQAENYADMKRKGRDGCSGEKNLHAILNADQVLEIRRDFKQFPKRKSNVQELAAKYGVSDQQIHSIVARRSWKHI